MCTTTDENHRFQSFARKDGLLVAPKQCCHSYFEKVVSYFTDDFLLKVSKLDYNILY